MHETIPTTSQATWRTVVFTGLRWAWVPVATLVAYRVFIAPTLGDAPGLAYNRVFICWSSVIYLALVPIALAVVAGVRWYGQSPECSQPSRPARLFHHASWLAVMLALTQTFLLFSDGVNGMSRWDVGWRVLLWWLGWSFACSGWLLAGRLIFPRHAGWLGPLTLLQLAWVGSFFWLDPWLEAVTAGDAPALPVLAAVVDWNPLAMFIGGTLGFDLFRGGMLYTQTGRAGLSLIGDYLSAGHAYPSLAGQLLRLLIPAGLACATAIGIQRLHRKLAKNPSKK